MSATEVWSTAGVTIGHAGTAREPTAWHASCGARSRVIPPLVTERDALASLRDKMVASLAAIDERLAELDAAAAAQPSRAPQPDKLPDAERRAADLEARWDLNSATRQAGARALRGEPVDIGPCRRPLWHGCNCEDCRARRIRRRRNLDAELEGLRQNIGHAELRVRELVEAGANRPGAQPAAEEELTRLVRALDRKKEWLPRLRAKIAADDANFGSDGRARRTFTHVDRALCRLLVRAGVPLGAAPT